jgi:uncharacterized membrane protein
VRKPLNTQAAPFDVASLRQVAATAVDADFADKSRLNAITARRDRQMSASLKPALWSQRRLAHVAVMALTLLAFLLRLVRIGYFNFSGDEALSALFSVQPIPDIVHALVHGEPHPPLFYVFLHFWIPFAGDEELSLRFVSTAANVATVPLIYVVASRLLAPRVGLIAASIVALNPYQLWNSQDARMYALATLLCLLALDATARYFDVNVRVGVALSDGRRRMYLAVYTAVMALALYTHYYSVYFFILFNLFAAGWLAVRRDRRIVEWIGAQCTVSALFAPWLIFAWNTITTYHGNGYSPPLQEALRRSIGTFGSGYVLPRDDTGIFFWAIVALLLAGVLMAARRNPAAVVLLALALLVPKGGVIIPSHTRPVFNERYLMAASPGFYIFVAASMLALRRRSPNLLTVISTVGLIALTTSNAVLVQRYLTATTTVAKARDASLLGAYLGSHATPQDRVIFNTADPTFLYYYHHANGQAPSFVAPLTQSITAANLDIQFQHDLDGVAHVWLVPDGIRYWDTHGLVMAWLDRHMVREADLEPKYQLLEFSSTPLSVRDPGVTFGGVILLVGTDAPAELSASTGANLQVTLYWRATSAISRDYTISVQLLDRSGKLVSQADAPPRDGAAPTNSWRTTETIPDTHTLQIPQGLPGGDYRLSVAVYDSATLRRLAIDGANADIAPLVNVHVLRGS